MTGRTAARVEVRLQPKASSNEVTGERNGKITIRVTAPPVDNKANKALVRLVADRLGIPKSRVKIIRGDKGRSKLLEIEGLAENEARARLLGD
jgi:uncharacterized protein (TIGR00251 family)